MRDGAPRTEDGVREHWCIDGLIEDLERIEQAYIAHDDYKTAAYEWERALLERQFAALRPGIVAKLHMGPSAVQSAIMLKEFLEKGNGSQVKEWSLQFRAYAAQTHLPKSDDLYT